MLPIELICEIPCKLVLPSHKISIGEHVLTTHFHRLPHTCTAKTLFFRYWRNLLNQQGIVSVHSYAHYNATHMRREKKETFELALSLIKWEPLYRLDSGNEKYVYYQTVIDKLIEICFPSKVVTRHTGDKPCITDGYVLLYSKNTTCPYERGHG